MQYRNTIGPLVIMGIVTMVSMKPSYPNEAENIALNDVPEVPMAAIPGQKQLDTSSIWKRFKTLHEAIPNTKDLTTLKSLQSKREILDPLVHEFFPQGRLASDLMSLLFARINNRREVLRPKRGRSPRPDYWVETMESYLGTQRRFRIILAFKDLNLQDSLVSIFEAQLHDAIAIISNSLKKAEEDPSEKDGFPGEITSNKEPKMTRSERVSEIGSFLGTVTDSLNIWGKSN